MSKPLASPNTARIEKLEKAFLELAKRLEILERQTVAPEKGSKAYEPRFPRWPAV